MFGPYKAGNAVHIYIDAAEVYIVTSVCVLISRSLVSTFAYHIAAVMSKLSVSGPAMVLTSDFELNSRNIIPDKRLTTSIYFSTLFEK